MSVWHDWDDVATIRCAQCNHVLGVVEASGAVVSRFRGRETVIDPAEAMVREALSRQLQQLRLAAEPVQQPGRGDGARDV